MNPETYSVEFESRTRCTEWATCELVVDYTDLIQFLAILERNDYKILRVNLIK